MPVELTNSSHSTAKSGHVIRNRSPKWTEIAKSCQADCKNGSYYVEICCDRWQCFKFSQVDFVAVIKSMLEKLPLSKLVELNVFLASLLSEKTSKGI